jgi:hypothetical protein
MQRFCFLLLSIVILNTNADVAWANTFLSDCNHKCEEYVSYYRKNTDQCATTTKQAEFIKSLFNEEITQQYIHIICAYIKSNYQYVPARGRFIGALTYNDIDTNKIVTGCHDYAIILATILRELDIPAALVDTISITWAKNYIIEPLNYSEVMGHVFVEAFINGKWRIIDPVQSVYIDDYDNNNPIIPITMHFENIGFYVIKRGLHMWDYNVFCLDDLENFIKTCVMKKKKIFLRFFNK